MEGIAEEPEGGEPIQVGTPYAEYGPEHRKLSVVIFGRANAAGAAFYKNTGEAYIQTKNACRVADINTRVLILPDGSIARNMLVVSRPSDDDLMPDHWPDSFVEVGLSAGGLVSGIALLDKWSNKVSDLGGVTAELVAAHVHYNEANNTSHAVQFEPNASRFDAKGLKDASIIGSTAEASVVKEMLQGLRAGGYGALRFFILSDAAPGVQLALGGWSRPWGALDLRSTKPICIIGIPKDEYEDALGSGDPAGVVEAELGLDVSIGRTFNMPGFMDAQRILVHFPLWREPQVMAAIEVSTRQAIEGHPIMVGGVKVSLVKPSSAEVVYTGLHNKEVREVGGGGGAALREKIAALSDQMQERELTAEAERTSAEAERTRAAAAAEVAARAAVHNQGELVRVGAEVVRLGGAVADAREQTLQLSRKLEKSEKGRLEAEKAARREAVLAADRDGEAKAARESMAQMQMQMAQMMASAVGGRSTMHGLQVDAAWAAPAQLTLTPGNVGGGDAAEADAVREQRGAVAEVAGSAAAFGRPGAQAACAPRGSRHAAGVSGRARVVGLLLCLTGSSPMPSAGSEPSKRGIRWGVVDGGAGRERGKFSAGGFGTVDRPRGANLSVCGLLGAPVCGASRGNLSCAANYSLAGMAARARERWGGPQEKGAAQLHRAGIRWLFTHEKLFRKQLMLRNHSCCDDIAGYARGPAREESGGCDCSSAESAGGRTAARRIRCEAASVECERGRSAPAAGGGTGHKLVVRGDASRSAEEDGARHGVAVVIARGAGKEPRDGECCWREQRGRASYAAVCRVEAGERGGCAGCQGGAGGGTTIPGGEGVQDGSATIRRGRRGSQGERSEGGPWQRLDGGPGSAGGGGARRSSAGEEEAAGVGHLREREHESHSGTARGADAGTGQDGGGGAHQGWAEAADAAGGARAGAAGERLHGGRYSTDAPQGRGTTDGHLPELGGVADSERAAGGAGVVGGGGRRAGRTRGAAAVAQRTGDGGGGRLRAWRKGAALRGHVRRRARHDSHGRAGHGRGAELRCVAVAEKCRQRLRCVSEAYAVPTEGRFRLANEMADRWSGRLDVLSVTPSCKKLSTAMHMPCGGGKAKRRKREGRKQLLADVAAAKRVVERCRPVIVMIEETACLHSHHSELYLEMQEELSSWPYEWRHGLVDCADLGAAHHRRRVLWVGVRKVEAAEA